MGTFVERTPAVSRIGIGYKVGVRIPLLEKVGKSSLEFCAKEVALARFLLKRGPEERRQFTVIMMHAQVGKLRSTTATDRQSAQLSNGLDQGRFSRAVLADKKCNGPFEREVEFFNERQRSREYTVLKDGSRSQVHALQERSHDLKGLAGNVKGASRSTGRWIRPWPRRARPAVSRPGAEQPFQ